MNDLFDKTESNHFQEFIRPVEAAVVGGLIGHWLDKTKFGVWFNSNKTIDAFYRIAGKCIVYALITLALYFCYCVISVFTQG